MVELVDTADLKSAARLGRDGSSPSEATMSAEFIGFVDPTSELEALWFRPRSSAAEQWVAILDVWGKRWK